MEQPFLLFLVGLTSAGAYWAGRRRLGLSARGIRMAAGKMLEGIGLTFVFLALNLLVGAVAILATRPFAGGYGSLYLIADETLLPLSLCQGLIFQWWREVDARGSREAVPRS